MEAETGGIFINGQNILPIRTSLIELYHLQPETNLKKDTSAYKVYSNFSIRKKRSKSWDMRFHWLRERDAQ